MKNQSIVKVSYCICLFFNSLTYISKIFVNFTATIIPLLDLYCIILYYIHYIILHHIVLCVLMFKRIMYFIWNNNDNNFKQKHV